MALKTESRQIGDYEYTVTQLDAVRGSRAFLRLSRILAPAFAEIASSQASGSTDFSRYAKAFEKVGASLAEEDLDYFRDMFAESTKVKLADGKAPKLASIFALHFAGDMFGIMQWLGFALEVNFGNFFDQIGLRFGSSPAAETVSP